MTLPICHGPCGKDCLVCRSLGVCESGLGRLRRWTYLPYATRAPATFYGQLTVLDNVEPDRARRIVEAMFADPDGPDADFGVILEDLRRNSRG